MKRQPFALQASQRSPGLFSDNPLTSFSSSLTGQGSSSISFAFEPPDLLKITNSSLAQIFKGLLKKESVTKSRSLEDFKSKLTSLISSDSNIIQENLNEVTDDAVLEAWTNLFPRLCIDTDRQVRLLSHTIQGMLCKLAGKRSLKYLGQIIGPWLSGRFESDIFVSEAARNALLEVFSTREKQYDLHRVYQKDIIGFCKAVLLEESPDTLSDKRYVSSDDAKFKYSRLVAASASLLSSILTILKTDDLMKCSDLYLDLTINPVLWDFSKYSDIGVRKSSHILLQSFLKTYSEIWADSTKNLTDAAQNAYAYKCLVSDQSGSLFEYLETLTLLTKESPMIWDNCYKSSKRRDVVLSLSKLFEAGSQTSSSKIWELLAQLTKIIPDSDLDLNYEISLSLMESFLRGIERKDEPRANLPIAYQSYLELYSILSARLNQKDRQDLWKSKIWPFFKTFINPQPLNVYSRVGKEESLTILQKSLTLENIDDVVTKAWVEYSTELSSIFESADFNNQQKSQKISALEQLSETSDNFSEVFTVLFNNSNFSSRRAELCQAFENLYLEIRSVPIEVIANAPKPVAIIYTIAKHSKNIKSYNERLYHDISRYTLVNGPKLIATPFSKIAAATLLNFCNEDGFEDTWNECIKNISATSVESNMEIYLQNLLMSALAVKDLKSKASFYNKRLQDVWIRQSERLESGGESKLLSFASSYPNDLFTEDTMAKIVAISVAIFETGNEAAISEVATLLNALLVHISSDFLKHVQSQQGAPLITFVFNTAENVSATDQSILLGDLGQKIIQVVLTGETPLGQNGSLLKVMKDITSVQKSSTTVNSLVKIGNYAIGMLSSVDKFLPDLKVFQREVDRFLNIKPKSSLSIISSIGGMINFEAFGAANSADAIDTADYDHKGRSVVVKMASYIIRLFSQNKAKFFELNIQDQILIIWCVFVVRKLVESELLLYGSSKIISAISLQNRLENLKVIEETDLWIKSVLDGVEFSWTTELENSEKNLLSAIMNQFKQSEGSVSGKVFLWESYSLFLSEIVSPLIQTGQVEYGEKIITKLRKVKSNLEVIELAYLANSMSSSNLFRRFLNEIMSDLTESKARLDSPETFQLLVTFNLLLKDEDSDMEIFSVQRVLYFVKKTLESLSVPDLKPISIVEAIKALIVVVPKLEDLYGEHWTKLMDEILSVGTSSPVDEDENKFDLSLGRYYNSLRLLEVLLSIGDGEEANDDLKDTIRESKPEIQHLLLSLLSKSSKYQDEHNSPRQTFNKKLSQLLQKSRPIDIDSDILADIISALQAQSPTIQAIAYETLHDYLPNLQEHLSIEIAIENKPVYIQSDLLKALRSPPEKKDLIDHHWENQMPHQLRTYLLTWLIIFDHFGTASSVLRSSYTLQIEETGSVKDLLDLLSQMLGLDNGTPISTQNIDVTNYDLGENQDPVEDAKALLCHLFYLCLKYLSGETKRWWLNGTARQRTIAVEDWSSTYFSPHVMQEALIETSDWAEGLVDPTDAEENKFSARVNSRANEVYVQYRVDESQTMAITINLPPGWPLRGAEVVGRERVAASERQWKTWLSRVQEIMTFSNNNIIDGITSWRRNVNALLEGQTECSICFALVGPDNQLPVKECSNCHNHFHGTCIFRWFRTGDTKLCPLCRTDFVAI